MLRRFNDTRESKRERNVGLEINRLINNKSIRAQPMRANWEMESVLSVLTLLK